MVTLRKHGYVYAAQRSMRSAPLGDYTNTPIKLDTWIVNSIVTLELRRMRDHKEIFGNSITRLRIRIPTFNTTIHKRIVH